MPLVSPKPFAGAAVGGAAVDAEGGEDEAVEKETEGESGILTGLVFGDVA